MSENMKNNPFADKIVVATGKLENYTRDGIQTKLLELGATPNPGQATISALWRSSS